MIQACLRTSGIAEYAGAHCTQQQAPYSTTHCCSSHVETHMQHYIVQLWLLVMISQCRSTWITFEIHHWLASLQLINRNWLSHPVWDVVSGFQWPLTKHLVIVELGSIVSIDCGGCQHGSVSRFVLQQSSQHLESAWSWNSEYSRRRLHGLLSARLSQLTVYRTKAIHKTQGPQDRLPRIPKSSVDTVGHGEQGLTDWINYYWQSAKVHLS